MLTLPSRGKRGGRILCHSMRSLILRGYGHTEFELSWLCLFFYLVVSFVDWKCWYWVNYKKIIVLGDTNLCIKSLFFIIIFLVWQSCECVHVCGVGGMLEGGLLELLSYQATPCGW